MCMNEMFSPGPYGDQDWKVTVEKYLLKKKIPINGSVNGEIQTDR